MSQRGRSGFLSYMLLLSRLLQFEHRSQEVAAPRGRGGTAGEAGHRGQEGLASPPFTHACPPLPAQLERLARRAQRARGHRALPARRAEQPVCAAAGGAVSGRGRWRGGSREGEGRVGGAARPGAGPLGAGRTWGRGYGRERAAKRGGPREGAGLWRWDGKWAWSWKRPGGAGVRRGLGRGVVSGSS